MTRRISLAFFFFLFLSSAFTARSSFAQTYLASTGSPTFTTALPVELGFINVANGNLHIEIPIASSPQRGNLRVNEKLVYDSRIWQVVDPSPSPKYWAPTNVPNSQAGWRFISGAESGAVSHTTSWLKCSGNNDRYAAYRRWKWTDPSGTAHYFSIGTAAVDTDVCPDDSDEPSGDAMATDATGYHMYVTDYTTATVYAADGTQVYPIWKDTNGNFLSTDTSGDLIDTRGVTPVTVTVDGDVTTYAVKTSGGTTNVVVTTASQPYQTAFEQFTDVSGTLPAITTYD